MQFFRDIPSNPMLLNGLLAGLLASVACGVIGPYVVTRRIVFLSGAIAHMAVGGVGAAIFLSKTFDRPFGWLSPLHGGLAAALLGAVLIGVINHYVAERLDTLIGAMWAIGMSVGILLVKLTGGYHPELMAYLFGNIAVVGADDVALMACLDVVIVGAVLLLHKRFLAVCLDEQQAELQGVRLLTLNIILLCLVAMTVICLIQVVGMILVLALLSLPAATAAHYAARMPAIIWLSVLLCALLTTVPRVAVYGMRVSAESSIVLAAGAVYLLSLGAQRLRRGT